MRFRSGRFWSGAGTKRSVLAVLVGFVPASLFLTPSAHATIVVGPASGYPAGNYVPLPQNYPPISTTSVYYPAINSAFGITTPGTVFTDPTAGFTTLDFGKYQYSSGNYIVLNVTSTLLAFNNMSSGGTPILVITMPGQNPGNPSATTSPVVASVANDPTQSSNCPSSLGCYDQVPVTSSHGSGGSVTHYYYRAFNIAPNQTITLALDMTTLCDSTGDTGSGCAQMITPSGGTTTGYTTLQLTFGVYIVPPGTPLNTIPLWNSSMAQGDTPVTVSFNFSVQPASGDQLTCSMSNAYYPGDQQIIVDGTQFTYPASTAPADALSAVDVLYSQATGGELGAYPSLATAINPTDQNAHNGGDGTYTFTEAPVQTAPAQVVGGFENSTSTTGGPFYAMGFIGRDNYGYLVAAATPSSCAYQTVVQTASIETFLKQSKCFIATATFRTADSPPLILLRAFRDHFLERFGLGRDFVHWYYAWSPGAADWLVANPVFRFPIFLALIPLQIFAWLVLHPITFMVLFGIGALVLGYGALSRERNGELRE